MLEINVLLSFGIKSEPLIDYRHSQILTSSDHIGKLTQIPKKKASIEKERVAKQKERKFTKTQRTTEKVGAIVAKKKRASENRIKKIRKQSWTTIAIRATSERLQSFCEK